MRKVMLSRRGLLSLLATPAAVPRGLDERQSASVPSEIDRLRDIPIGDDLEPILVFVPPGE